MFDKAGLYYVFGRRNFPRSNRMQNVGRHPAVSEGVILRPIEPIHHVGEEKGRWLYPERARQKLIPTTKQNTIRGAPRAVEHFKINKGRAAAHERELDEDFNQPGPGYDSATGNCFNLIDLNEGYCISFSHRQHRWTYRLNLSLQNAIDSFVGFYVPY